MEIKQKKKNEKDKKEYIFSLLIISSENETNEIGEKNKKYSVSPKEERIKTAEILYDLILNL